MELQASCKALTEGFNQLPDAITQVELNYFLFTFSEKITALERVYSRQDIVSYLREIRHAVAVSPFLKRAQQWPRGYAGDFETIDYILSGVNQALPGTLAHAIEEYFLESPVCSQHKNKVQEQARLIKETLERNPAAHILSIGCGTSEDLFQCLPEIERSNCHITLIDIDAMALQHSQSRLSTVSGKITFIEGNIYRIIKRLTGPFDLVIIGGVFDYLNDKVIMALLNAIIPELHDNGVLFFTNIAENNPYRVCMEYLADWMLIGRSRMTIEELLLNSKASELHSDIRKEKAGLTWLVTLYYKPEAIAVTGDRP